MNFPLKFNYNFYVISIACVISSKNEFITNSHKNSIKHQI
ncbi:hypothetical protein HMPREF9089_01164 [Eubacterium brachy ATCC 33089]|nr:hypothetical protein HMPREF9089_01164 [Eubacterium brachy ATCC 33089]